MNPNKSVVLVGPMGVGKTTIGKKLAKKLELPFVDSDAVITKRFGSPTEIFEKHGEAHFRNLEVQVINEALLQTCVLATGGGAVTNEEVRAAIKTQNVIYLKTNGRHMEDRLSKGNRPLLKNGFEDWKRIYEERKPIFKSVADYEIDTSNTGLKNIILEICQLLEEHHDRN